MKKDLAKKEKLLRDKGFKITPARLAILSAFCAHCEPLNAEEINKKIKKEKIDPVTIYRTLASFEKKGILKRVDLRKDSACFELSDTHHHHIICIKCGMIEEFRDLETESLTKRIIKNSKNFKQIKQHSFEMFGLCKKCS